MSRTPQVLSSLAAVVGAYFLYWLIVLPLIEPNLEARPIARATQAELDAAHDNVDARQRDVAQYFPADSWELKNPAVWESQRARLLFKSLRPLPDGRVELKPCTLLFFSKSSVANPAEPKRPIIMRAMQGAIVQFDEPIVLKSVDLSKRQLVGGDLSGPIHIYQNPSRPGAQDDLEITTRDVQMLKDRVWTPHVVQFRLGRNRGTGREMEIQLTASEASSQDGFRPDGVRSLELMRDVKMLLFLARQAVAPAAQPRQDRPEPPLEVTCQGKFEFQMQSYAASFHKQVNVVQPGLLGEADQMNCELLSVLFDPHAAKPAAAPGTPAPPADADMSSLSVKMIQARGDPVTVSSPQRGVYMRCRGIDYTPGASGAIGSFLAIGPGTAQRNLPADPAGKFDATWAREFRFEPDGPLHVARLRGAGVVRFAEMGTITADEIFAWLSSKNAPPTARPAGPTTESDRWQLEKVLAHVYQDKSGASQGPVVVDSPQLHAVTDRLEAWVDRPPAAAQLPVAAPTTSAVAAAQPAPEPKRPAQAARQNPAQRFDVHGRKVQIKLVPDGDQLAVSAATIEDQAQLQEMTPQAGQRPLLVKGDRLHVTDANTDATRVAVGGNPGLVEGGGLTLSGRLIEMERKSNRVWIDGPGRMTMPVDQDLNGQPLASPQSLVVTWKGGMNFQTSVVVFSQAVVAQSEQQQLNTEKMEVTLSRPVDFNRPPRANPERPDDRPQVARLRCYGPSLLRSRELDDHGKQLSSNLVQAFDLAVDRPTGEITARGPGTVSRVARGAVRPLEARTGAATTAPPARRQPPGDELTYLNVVFQDSINGNMLRRQITFGNSTKTVYGPVESWEGRLDPDAPGPQGMVMEARRLTVREMPTQVKDKRGWFELEGQGNVVAEGAQFTARGDRITYSEDKDQIVLRGDAQSPAEFFQEDGSGGARRESTANELTYWLGMQRLLVTGIKSFSVDAPSNRPAKQPPANQAPAKQPPAR